MSFHRSYDLPIRIVRPFHTFGPRQSARAFIPSLIVQLLSGAQTNGSPAANTAANTLTANGSLGAIGNAAAAGCQSSHNGTGTPKIKLGNLAPTRDFSYIQDTVRGFVSIAESTATVGEVINIATGREHSIGDIAQHLISQINPQSRIVPDKTRMRPAKSEVDRLLGSNDKIRRLTIWRPQVTFEEGLKATVHWFRENLERYKADRYNV
jgi:dTDP-glucose 4,6-dehydratase